MVWTETDAIFLRMSEKANAQQQYDIQQRGASQRMRSAHGHQKPSFVASLAWSTLNTISYVERSHQTHQPSAAELNDLRQTRQQFVSKRQNTVSEFVTVSSHGFQSFKNSRGD